MNYINLYKIYTKTRFKRPFGLVILIGVIISFSFPAQALWLSGYEYRKQITINGSGDGNLTDYQLMLNVYKGSGTDSGNSVYINSIQDDFSDVRFTNSAGTELDYWIEEKNDGSNARVWIEFDSLPQSTSTDFYMYYGNNSASSDSNGDDTFLYFDDFLGTALSGDWEGDTGNFSVGSGVLTSSTSDKKINVKDSVFTGSDYAIECRGKATSPGTVFDVITIARNGTNFYQGYWDGYNDIQYIQRSTDWAVITQNSHTISSDTFYIISFMLDGTALKLTVSDDDRTGGITSSGIDSSLSSGEVGIRTWGGSGFSMDVDWFAVRNYTSDEPIWSTWGSEEGVIPEPASLLLLGLGITNLALFGKRRV